MYLVMSKDNSKIKVITFSKLNLMLKFNKTRRYFTLHTPKSLFTSTTSPYPTLISKKADIKFKFPINSSLHPKTMNHNFWKLGAKYSRYAYY